MFCKKLKKYSKLNKHFYRLLFFSLCAFVLVSAVACRQINVYEKNTSIPKMEWSKDFAAMGTFNIDDTMTAYKLFIVLRHTDAYAYNNIWLNVGLQPPGDSMYFQKLDLLLGSDADGWQGTGMNDIWEVRKLLNGEPRRFKKTGEYNYKIMQVMRDDPLKSVMNAGMRIEKAP